MIRHFYIDNFKSLVGFSLPPKPAKLAQFTCLIGANGTGKSTVLQAFDFIKQLTHGRMDDWLTLRDWKKSEIVSHFQRKRLISFRLEFEFEFAEFESITWEGQFNPSLLRCTAESVKLREREILKFADGELAYSTSKLDDKLKTQDLDFQGSILSALLLDKAHPAIRLMREFVRDLKSLDMLAPNLMRKRSRDAEDVGYGGERLSAFLADFHPLTKTRLLELLKKFYSHTFEISTSSVQGGWKDLKIAEMYLADTSPVFINARHLNDGMLRILAILSQIEAKDAPKDVVDGILNKMDLPPPIIDGFNADVKKRGYLIHHEYRALLFDEIENGIHPELIEKLMAYLLEAEQQIIVTTHSPMILNYLPDEVAKETVILLYRTERGITRAVRYFDLPSAKKKLELLGPGEVFVDTDLASLTLEAESLHGA